MGTDFESISAEITELTVKLQRANEAVILAEAEKQKALKERDAAMEQASSLVFKRERIQADVATMKKAIESMQKKIEQAESQIQAELNAAHNAEVAAKEELEKLRSDAKGRNAEIQSKIETTNSNIAETKQTIQLIRDRLNSQKDQIAEAHKLRSILSERRALGLHEELVSILMSHRAAETRLKAQIDSSVSEIVNRQKEILSMNAEIEELRNKIRTSLETKAKAEDMLVDSQSKIIAKLAEKEKEKARVVRVQLNTESDGPTAASKQIAPRTPEKTSASPDSSYLQSENQLSFLSKPSTPPATSDTPQFVPNKTPPTLPISLSGAVLPSNGEQLHEAQYTIQIDQSIVSSDKPSSDIAVEKKIRPIFEPIAKQVTLPYPSALKYVAEQQKMPSEAPMATASTSFAQSNNSKSVSFSSELVPSNTSDRPMNLSDFGLHVEPLQILASASNPSQSSDLSDPSQLPPEETLAPPSAETPQQIKSPPKSLTIGGMLRHLQHGRKGTAKRPESNQSSNSGSTSGSVESQVEEVAVTIDPTLQEIRSSTDHELANLRSLLLSAMPKK